MTLLVLVLANLNTLEGHISRPAISGEKMCCTHENFTHTSQLMDTICSVGAGSQHLVLHARLS